MYETKNNLELFVHNNNIERSNMKQSIKLLNAVYQICEKLLERISPMINEAEEQEFQKELLKIKENTEKMKYRIDAFLASVEEEEQKLGKIEKVQSYLTSKMSILTNNDPKHIATIIKSEIETLVRELKEEVHIYKEANKEVLKLATELEEELESHIIALETWI